MKRMSFFDETAKITLNYSFLVMSSEYDVGNILEKLQKEVDLLQKRQFFIAISLAVLAIITFVVILFFVSSAIRRRCRRKKSSKLYRRQKDSFQDLATNLQLDDLNGDGLTPVRHENGRHTSYRELRPIQSMYRKASRSLSRVSDDTVIDGLL